MDKSVLARSYIYRTDKREREKEYTIHMYYITGKCTPKREAHASISRATPTLWPGALSLVPSNMVDRVRVTPFISSC